MTENWEKYLSSWDGQNQKFQPSTTGYWMVHGEDDDRTRGPFLGIFHGTLYDVVNYVTELKGFYSWGGGGTVEKVNVTMVTEDSVAQRKKLLEEKEKLERSLADIKSQLPDLE